MSVESISKALRVDGLDPTEKLLLVGIANHDGDGGAWPSIATLAGYLSLSERSTQRYVRRLIDAGLITVDYNTGGTAHTRGDRRPNRFTIHWSAPVDKALHGVTRLSPRDNLLQLHGVTDLTPRGDKSSRLSRSRGDRALSPEPSFEQKKNRPYAREFSAECELSTDTPRRFGDCIARAVGDHR